MPQWNNRRIMLKRSALLTFFLAFLFFMPAYAQQKATTTNSSSAELTAALAGAHANAALRMSQPQLAATHPQESILAVTGSLGLSPSASDECPSAQPLDCRNGYCCPTGHTLHCPRHADSSQCQDVPDGMRGCYDPSKLTSDQLAILRNCCPGLASCS